MALYSLNLAIVLSATAHAFLHLASAAARPANEGGTEGPEDAWLVDGSVVGAPVLTGPVVVFPEDAGIKDSARWWLSGCSTIRCGGERWTQVAVERNIVQ